MGWAKYYEDNESIYIGRMAMRDSAQICFSRPEPKIEPLHRASNPDIPKPTVRNVSPFHRNGLKLSFPSGIEEKMIRRLQMNGWWWSKSNACWCNLNTAGNLSYAKTLVYVGAKLQIA